MNRIIKLLRKTINLVKSLFLYSLDLFKRRKYLLGSILLSISCVIMVVLYLIGGWALVTAYIICRLSGACPV